MGMDISLPDQTAGIANTIHIHHAKAHRTCRLQISECRLQQVQNRESKSPERNKTN